MTERDYSEALTVEFDMEIQSEEFGLKNTISIEGSTCDYYEKKITTMESTRKN